MPDSTTVAEERSPEGWNAGYIYGFVLQAVQERARPKVESTPSWKVADIGFDHV